MYGIFIKFKTTPLSNPLEIERESLIKRLSIYGFMQHEDNLFLSEHANAVTTVCSFQSAMEYHPLLINELAEATMLRLEETTNLLPSLSILNN